MRASLWLPALSLIEQLQVLVLPLVPARGPSLRIVLLVSLAGILLLIPLLLLLLLPLPVAQAAAAAAAAF